MLDENGQETIRQQIYIYNVKWTVSNSQQGQIMNNELMDKEQPKLSLWSDQCGAQAYNIFSQACQRRQGGT